MFTADTAITRSTFHKLCYYIAAISATLGMAVWFATGYLPIFYVELFITVFLAVMPAAGRYLSLQTSLFMVFMLLSAALVFYGIILGPVAQIHILVVFLFGAAILFMQQRRKVLAFSICMAVMISFLQFNYYYNWFTPIRMDAKTEYFVNNIVIFTGTFLSVFVVYYFYKNWTNKKTQLLLDQIRVANKSHQTYTAEFSHEVRQPITVVYGMSSLLLESDGETRLKDVRPILESLYAASNQLTRIANNNIELAKIEAGIVNVIHNEKFAVRPWITKNMAVQQYFANGSNIFINLLISPNFPEYITSDPDILNQILNNLMGNAIKFSPPQSTIEVSLKVTAANEWHLSVKDQGKGMDAVEAEKIFENFHTSGRMHNSSGLGLGIVKRHVKDLSGRLDVVSEPDKGATFIVTFPMDGIPAGIVPFKKTLIPFEDTTHARILVIEDDRQNQVFYRTMLGRSFSQVTIAENGTQGLQMVREELPDLIILDNTLPDMMGVDVLTTLKQDENVQHIPVIIVTGDLEIDEANMLQLGAAHVIRKPYMPHELKEKIVNNLKLRSAI